MYQDVNNFYSRSCTKIFYIWYTILNQDRLASLHDRLDLKEEIYERWWRLFTKWKFEKVEKERYKRKNTNNRRTMIMIWKNIKEKLQKKEEDGKEEGRNRSCVKFKSGKGKPGIFKKNGPFHGLFDFVTRTVNILVFCYIIYEN